MDAGNIAGVAIVVAVLALAILLAAPSGREGVASRAAIRAEQEASIANREVAGLKLPRVIDLLGTSMWQLGGESGVHFVGAHRGPGGSAFIDSEMTSAMVSASWGTPDTIDNNGNYIYYQPPYGEVHVSFTNNRERKQQVAFIVSTVLYPAYFKREHPTWTDATCSLVAAEQLALGMTAEMARASWGSPSKINRSVGSWGVHEQWVYNALTRYHSPRYIYFENGTLTSWQD